MGVISQIGLLLVNAILGFYLFSIVLRFLLQVARADYHNPVSQFIVKVTNPALIPLRRFIPGLGGLDIASLVLALLVQMLAITLSALFLLGFDIYSLPAGLNIFAWAVLGVCGLFLKFFFWGLLISVIASWVAAGSYNPALMLLQQVLEPVMQPVRRMLPDTGGIDISPIVVFLSIQVLEILLHYAAQQVAAPGFIIGL
jgi:YggT family protein